MRRKGLVLRKLEQLERKIQPQHESGGLIILDHAPTAEELADICKKYGSDILVVHEDLPLPD